MNWLAHKYYLYNLWTGLYMLDPWEKACFNTVVVSGAVMTVYYASQFLAPLVAAEAGSS